MPIQFGVLGSTAAWNEAGDTIELKGPRHRAVLARLIAARGRMMPLTMLIDDLWDEPPADAAGAIRTFVGDLRRALEPGRPPRARPQLLVTEGSGYALRADDDAIDARRFERAIADVRALPADSALRMLEHALSEWRGPAYADYVDDAWIDERWARAERSRLSELRLNAVELLAESRLNLGRPADAVPDLDAHVTEHPWRENGWRLLALALYRTGRQRDALAVVRRARALLVEQLGVDPHPELDRLETDILNQADQLGDASASSAADRVWATATTTYDRTVAPGSRARLRSTVDLLRSLAVTGGSGLEAAQQQRLATIRAAEESGDPELIARVIGAYDVPAIWTRSDDPDRAALIVASAERALGALSLDAGDAIRARLLATIAVESRGLGTARALDAARSAEAIARRLDDPALLAFALNGVFMQSFFRAGLAGTRDEIGTELIAVSSRHGLATYEVLGHLICMQSRSAFGDIATADAHTANADRLAGEYESPLVDVFTGWYRALRLALTNQPFQAVTAGYERAAAALVGAGMPGLESGLSPLARLAARMQHGLPPEADDAADWGPYDPWVRPLMMLARGDRDAASAALHALPEPPADHLMEVLWCLAARAAVALDDHDVMLRASAALAPAASEFAGAGSGLFTVGPVSRYLGELAAALA